MRFYEVIPRKDFLVKRFKILHGLTPLYFISYNSRWCPTLLNSLRACYINAVLVFGFLKIILLIYFWPSGSSSLCRLSSGCGGQGQLFVAMLGFLFAVASLAAERGLEGHGLQ